jgi:enoyl-[acyl-carrier protein] reductase II
MAGQSVGMVTEIQPVAEILRELKAQAVAALMARADAGTSRAEGH